jgi:hypothetical protein
MASVLALTACERAAREEPVRPVTSATLVVENTNWLDATVYVLRSGVRHRLGNAGSFQPTTFDLPGAVTITGEFTILVELIGSTASWISPAVVLLDHSLVELRIAAALSLSTVTVWEREPDAPARPDRPRAQS